MGARGETGVYWDGLDICPFVWFGVETRGLGGVAVMMVVVVVVVQGRV